MKTVFIYHYCAKAKVARGTLYIDGILRLSGKIETQERYHDVIDLVKGLVREDQDSFKEELVITSLSFLGTDYEDEKPNQHISEEKEDE